MTLTEMKEHLNKEEETILLELLDITSEDVVERFTDKIEERFDILLVELEIEEEDD